MFAMSRGTATKNNAGIPTHMLQGWYLRTRSTLQKNNNKPVGNQLHRPPCPLVFLGESAVPRVLPCNAVPKKTRNEYGLPLLQPVTEESPSQC